MVSFVVTNYNKQKSILVTLASIISVIDVKDELIFIDDGSTDNSLMLAERYLDENISNYTIIKLVNSGVSNARNQGIKKAKNEWIFQIDGDDYIRKSEFVQVKKCLGKYQCDVIICDFLFAKDSFHKANPNTSKEFIFSLSQCEHLKILPRVGSIFIRKKICPNFNTKINLYEDLLFMDAFVGLKALFINKTILSYEFEGNSLSVYDRSRLHTNYGLILNARLTNGLISILFTLLSKKEVVLLMLRFPKLFYFNIIVNYLLRKI